MILTGISAFFARSMAYAFGLSVIKAVHSAGIFPDWMASITAWKFEPLPEARTAIRFFIVLSFKNAGTLLLFFRTYLPRSGDGRQSWLSQSAARASASQRGLSFLHRSPLFPRGEEGYVPALSLIHI